MWVIIPLKDLDRAKSRLAEVLAPTPRRQLFILMARAVIRAAQAMEGCAGVLVVTPSADVARIAQDLGAGVLMDAQAAGMAAACTLGLARLAAEGVERAMILPGDLPSANAADLAQLVRRLREGPGVVLVPDARGEGTNALLLAPPGVIAPAFGPKSAQAHEEAARRAGVPIEVVQVPALQRDLDDPEDLEAYRKAAITSGAPEGADHTLWAFLSEINHLFSDE